MLKLITDFLTYVRVRGTEYNMVIKAIQEFGGDVLMDMEAKLLKMFSIQNLCDLLDEDKV